MVRYCRCGYKVWVTEEWNGIKNILIVHADDETDPEHAGQEITHCPRCGVRAYPTDLLTEPPDAEEDLDQILLQTIPKEEMLLNLARLVLELTTPSRRFNGRGRPKSYVASKDAIADAARHLAEKVIEFIAPSTNDPEAPFGP